MASRHCFSLDRQMSHMARTQQCQNWNYLPISTILFSTYFLRKVLNNRILVTLMPGDRACVWVCNARQPDCWLDPRPKFDLEDHIHPLESAGYPHCLGPVALLQCRGSIQPEPKFSLNKNCRAPWKWGTSPIRSGPRPHWGVWLQVQVQGGLPQTWSLGCLSWNLVGRWGLAHAKLMLRSSWKFMLG